ncbi:MAG: protoporphyrinogen oxidase [Candidatus Dadabacteria bacterium]|nr:MAG: protoporphyrinogen oxidase [Candidatus Dadabacteria bacterium]
MVDDLVILGAGLTGLACGYFLKKEGWNNFHIYEKNGSVGGVCRSVSLGDFTFDHAGHFLHFQDDVVRKEVLSELLDENFSEHTKRSGIYLDGTITPYPFQKNLAGLPLSVVRECLVEFLKARLSYKERESYESFSQWVRERLGLGIGRYFMFPYNEKLWTVPLDELTTEWMGRFVPKVSALDVIGGALFKGSEGEGYNASFYYPLQGGIQSLPDAILKKAGNVTLNCRALRVDAARKEVEFEDGRRQSYDVLVSTIPLKYFVEIVEGLEPSVYDAADLLRHNTVCNYNLVLRRRIERDEHWLYFPERNLPFYRIGLLHNIKETDKDTSVLSVEVAYKRRDFSVEEAFKGIVEGLKGIGFLEDESDIVLTCPLKIEVAYAIFDRNRKRAVSHILRSLESKGIYSIGRYGRWTYCGMEQSFLDAKALLKRLGIFRED